MTRPALFRKKPSMIRGSCRHQVKKMYVVHNQSSASRQFQIRPTIIIVLEVTILEKDIKSKPSLIVEVTSFGRPRIPT